MDDFIRGLKNAHAEAALSLNRAGNLTYTNWTAAMQASPTLLLGRQIISPFCCCVN